MSDEYQTLDDAALQEVLAGIERRESGPLDHLVEDVAAIEASPAGGEAVEMNGGDGPSLDTAAAPHMLRGFDSGIYRWPVRRNSDGATGSTDVTGPQYPHSQWHFGWSRHIHTRFPRAPIHAPVVRGDQCFFVDEDDPLLISVDNKGHMVWAQREMRYDTEPCVADDGSVYVGAYLVNSRGEDIGFLVQVDGGSGQRTRNLLTDRRFASLSALDISATGRVVGVLRDRSSSDGELIGYDPVSDSAWRVGGRLASGWPRVWAQADALAYGELVYTWGISGAGISISAFDESNGSFAATSPVIGTPTWKLPLGGLAMAPEVPHLGLDARLAFTVGPFEDLLVLQDAALASPATAVSLSSVVGRPVVTEQAPAIRPDGEMYVAVHGPNFEEPVLVAVDPMGSFVWHAWLASPATTAPVVDADGMIYVGTRTHVQCFEPGGGERYRIGIRLSGGDSLSLGEHGQLYYQDGGILTSVE